VITGEEMSGTIITILAAFAVFLVLWIVLSRRKEKEEKPVTYVCMECGEKDCICYREEDISGKQN
jgi:hypothetical protein